MSNPLRHEKFNWEESKTPELDVKERINLVKPELRDFFAQGIELTDDLGAVNDQLKKARRDDLVIYSPANVLDIKTVQDVVRLGATGYNTPPRMDVGNNFFKSFYLRSPDGFRSITDEEIEGMRRGTYTPEPTPARPIQKPVIIRMLILPEVSQFTESLIMNMSSRNPGYQKQKLEQELFVAYTLASRLVCETDEGVKGPDGTVDPRYLVR